MTAYVGINGAARNIAASYIGVDGVARKITKAYVGVNGVAQLWWVAERNPKPAVLQVEKFTSDTYAGETTYTGESFILLNVYPKTNGTVKITYGGLTKTITDTSGAEEPNAQKVFFGTFNGASDSVETPASGTLTIEGAYRGYGLGTFSTNSKGLVSYATNSITGIIDMGEPAFIPGYAFYMCSNITLSSLPNGIAEIGSYAFYGCLKINITEIPEGVVSIGDDAFHMTTKAASEITMSGATVTFPRTLQSIGTNAFTSDYYTGDYLYYTYIDKAVMTSETPPVFGENAFGKKGGTMVSTSGSSYVTFVVPKGCVAAYKAAEGWPSLANCVEVN